MRVRFRKKSTSVRNVKGEPNRMSLQYASECCELAEGAGSFSKKEFSQFLDIARRSVFECANVLFIFHRRSVIEKPAKDKLLFELDLLSKKITSFRRTLIDK